MIENVSSKELSARRWAQLYNVSVNTIKKWITNGRFPTAHKVRDRGGDGWAIGIDDPGIDPAIRELWKTSIRRSYGLSVPENWFETVQDRFQQIVELLQKIVELLEKKSLKS